MLLTRREKESRRRGRRPRATRAREYAAARARRPRLAASRCTAMDMSAGMDALSVGTDISHHSCSKTHELHLLQGVSLDNEASAEACCCRIGASRLQRGPPSRRAITTVGAGERCRGRRKTARRSAAGWGRVAAGDARRRGTATELAAAAKHCSRVSLDEQIGKKACACVGVNERMGMKASAVWIMLREKIRGKKRRGIIVIIFV